MLPANGFKLNGENVELSYMSVMHPMKVTDLSPLQLEILINGKEVNPYETTLTTNADGDDLPINVVIEKNSGISNLKNQTFPDRI